MQRLVEEVRARAAEYNGGHYAYAVMRLILFGSVAAGKDRPGDVDIAVELERRNLPDAVFERLEEEAEDRAPVGVGLVRRIGWAEEEAIRFLKGGSRGLSIHRYKRDKKAVEEGVHRVIFEARPLSKA